MTFARGHYVATLCPSSGYWAVVDQRTGEPVHIALQPSRRRAPAECQKAIRRLAKLTDEEVAEAIEDWRDERRRLRYVARMREELSWTEAQHLAARFRTESEIARIRLCVLGIDDELARESQR